MQRAPSSSGAATTASAPSPGTTPPARSCRATDAWPETEIGESPERRCGMRVAFHAGQLLQPVPGGIGRYSRAILDRLSSAGVDPIAFAAGARPAGLASSVPWIDLGSPHGSVRYEMWHRFRRPAVRLPADLVHAPSLAITPA